MCRVQVLRINLDRVKLSTLVRINYKRNVCYFLIVIIPRFLPVTEVTFIGKYSEDDLVIEIMIYVRLSLIGASRFCHCIAFRDRLSRDGLRS